MKFTDVIKYEDIDIMIEGTMITSANDFLTVFCVMMGAYYVFNVTYVPRVSSTMILL